MGAGLVGGLVCTFSDSIGFPAVEAEVYAMSSYFHLSLLCSGPFLNGKPLTMNQIITSG